MRNWIKGIVVLLAVWVSGFAHAQTPATLYYQTYLDVDGNAATGCIVIVPDNLSVPQTLTGVDASLKLTVTNGVLVSSERFACVGGVMTSQGMDAGHPSYTLGGAFIEYRLPNVTLTANSSIGFAASTDTNFGVPSDVMFAVGGNPIPLAPLLAGPGGTTVPIPLSTPGLLLLTAVAFGLIAARYLRTSHGHRIVGALALVICLASASGAVISATVIILDGNDSDWAGVPILATDAAGDAPYPEIDLLRAYGVYQGSDLYLKLDLTQKPVNNVTPPLLPLADFRILGANVTEPNISSQVTVSGTANQIRGTATSVNIKNQRTGQTATATLIANNWQTDLTAQVQDILLLTPIAADNREGGTIQVVVQGTAAQPTLPPNPSAIAPALDPLLPYTVYDSTKFLYTNNPPVQIGVSPDTIKPKTAALLVGKVLDRQNQQLAGVTVTVKDHNEYGYTYSRTDGQWDLVVNGGTWFTVEYKKEGFITIQRKVQVAWQDYGYLPDVVMIPLDEKVTVVDLRETAADAPSFQIHQGSISTDADGPRQATILFPKGTTAQLEMPNGSTQTIDVLNVRATEYTVGDNGPNAMPGELPPATGYTYAVELSVDQAIVAGAKHVRFSQPLPVYVDNFLEFSVGGVVPVGWYSYDKKAWVPDDNGRVIKVLAVNNSSAVLDVKGQGNSATETELQSLGITDDELKAIAGLYPAGKTLWRVTATHFTPGDYNWPYGTPPCGVGESCGPTDKIPKPSGEPNDPIPPSPPPQGCENSVPSCSVQVESRTMSESLSIAGTELSINYSTTRAPGYLENFNYSKRYLRDDKPLQRDIKTIRAKAQLLGRTITTFEANASNVSAYQTDRFEWDGKDRYGRTLYNTAAEVTHTLAYEVPLIYYPVSQRDDRDRSFAQYGDSTQAISNSLARTASLENTIRKTVFAQAEDFSRAAKVDALGSWTISAHHHYDPVRRILEKGTGARRTQLAVGQQLSLIEVNIKVIDDKIRTIGSFTILPDGKILLTRECYDCAPLFQTVSANGNVETFTVQGLPADIRNISLLRYDDIEGGVYLVSEGKQIYYRQSDGQVRLLAGKTGSPFTGNADTVVGDVTFGRVNDLMRGHDGILYISDGGSQCLRKLDADGYVRTVAGTCGDGSWSNYLDNAVPAKQFKLANPYGVAQAQDGTLYLSDAGQRRVYKISNDGMIAPYVGMGVRGSESQLENNEADPQTVSLAPCGLATNRQGELYISSSWGCLDNWPGYLYRRDADGRMSIVVGDLSAISGEAMLPAEMRGGGAGEFNALRTNIRGITLRPDGENALLVRDSNGSIRRLALALPGFDGSDILVPEAGGKQAYLFNAHGRHLKTLDALTGATLYTFSYNSDGTLAGMTDFDGNTTRVERSGESSVIISPYGHRTELTVNNGLLKKIRNPVSATWAFDYNAGGAITRITEPDTTAHTYEYDIYNRLTSTRWANGGGWTITQDPTNNSWTHDIKRDTTYVSGEGLRKFYTSFDKSPQSERTSQQPDGTHNRSSRTYYGSYSESMRGDQTVVSTVTSVGDPRFGTMASYTSGSRTETRGVSTNIPLFTTKRFTELNDSGQLFPVKRWGEETQDSHLPPNRRIYDHAEGSWTNVSPGGHTSTTFVDALHRPQRIETPGMPTALYTYVQGKVTQLEIKPSEGASRISRNEYDAQGNLSKVTDPLGRAVTYEYDAIGRLLKQTLPDSRSIRQEYDAMGNLTKLITPAGEEHLFSYNTMGDKSGYIPPQVSNTATTYYYNKDRQPVRTVLPGGSELTWTYDSASGRLTQIAYSESIRTPIYDSALRPTTLTDGPNTLIQLYDSTYDGGQQWQGEVNAAYRVYRGPYVGLPATWEQVTRREVTANGPAALRQGYNYGQDNELTAQHLMKLGANNRWELDRKITFDRDPQTLRLKQMKGWSTKDKDERTYNAFGELTGYRYFPLRDVGQLLDNADVTVTGNDGPADLIKITGQLNLTGAFADLNRLWLTPERIVSDYSRPSDQWFAIENSGNIAGRTMTLSGDYGTTRKYTLSVAREGETQLWTKEIGPIARRTRNRAPIDGVRALQSGATPLLYGLNYNDDYELEVTQVNPESGNTQTFRPQGTGTFELIGAVDGKVFLHHSGGGWDCGETNGIANDCITLQSQGHAELIGALPKAALNTKHTVRYIEGTGREFYLVTGQESILTRLPVKETMLKETPEDTLQIERWNAVANTRTEVTRLTVPDIPSTTVVHAETAGTDLLLAIGEETYDRGRVGPYYRIKADGNRIAVPHEEEGSDIAGIFGDGDANCYLRKNEPDLPSEYICKNSAGEETQRSVLPPRNLNYYYSRASLKHNPATRTLYIVLPGEGNDTDTVLWHLQRPADRDSGLWRTVFEPIPIKTVTVNIGGSIDEQGMGYNIAVERDPLGRVTQKTEILEGRKTQQTYTYDLGGRLTEVKTGENGEQTDTWGYDANGNRTTHNGTPIATFDAQDRLLTQSGTTYEHNLLGQRTKKTGPGGTTTYRYDNLGNLREANVNGTTITYAIDPQDRRIGRKENGTWTHKWIYQDSLNPIAELDANDRIRKAFVYADKGHVPSYMITYNTDGTENKQYRLVSDLLGSVRAVYDLTTGNLIQQLDYDVWGNITNDTNPDFQPFGFAGGLYDQTTKLTRFGARDYDPETGRWTAKDPIRFDGGDTNLYGYVLNNPVNFVDPEGLKYTDEECALLKQWIADQWKTFWVYFERARTGEISTGIQTLTHTASGCDSLYPDAGRRLACRAHEDAHKWWQYFMMTPHFYEDSKGYVKQLSQFELIATEAGIKKGESLYRENCEDCK